MLESTRYVGQERARYVGEVLLNVVELFIKLIKLIELIKLIKLWFFFRVRVLLVLWR